MAASNVYVTIGLDRAGSVVEVRVNGEIIEPKESPGGPSRVGEGAPGCEQIVKRLEHELLMCRKKKTPPDTPPPIDPCCYRDPATGRIWCWC
jgi:hypothetical protein